MRIRSVQRTLGRRQLRSGKRAKLRSLLSCNRASSVASSFFSPLDFYLFVLYGNDPVMLIGYGLDYFLSGGRLLLPSCVIRNICCGIRVQLHSTRGVRHVISGVRQPSRYEVDSSNECLVASCKVVPPDVILDQKFSQLIYVFTDFFVITPFAKESLQFPAFAALKPTLPCGGMEMYEPEKKVVFLVTLNARTFVTEASSTSFCSAFLRLGSSK